MHIALSLPEREAPPWMGLFCQALPEASLALHEPDRAPCDARRADYVIAAYPSSTLFVEQPAPKAVFTLSAGVGHVLRLANLPRGVPLVRVEDAGMAAQMIRYALTAVLRFTQRLDTYRCQQRERHWTQHDPRDPAQVTVGVMGLGVIGGAIASELARQQFNVRGYARHRKEIAGVACCTDLASFLDRLDVVVNVLPGTSRTKGLLDRAAMERLADGAHVVNIGRGSTLVDEDLVALLDSGKLSGATLDVFNEEPLPASHPFWERPEVTLTPHVAGVTIPDETVAQIASKIRSLERGERVTGLVDRAHGY